jgi:hypothetical protein
MDNIPSDLSYSVIISPTVKNILIRGNNTNFMISGLSTNTTYNVQVSASSAGKTGTSSVLTFTTENVTFVQYITSLSAIAYITFNNSTTGVTNNISGGNTYNTVGSPPLVYQPVDGYNSVVIYNTGFTSFFTINISNPTYLTYAYWLHAQDIRTDPIFTVCITNTTNVTNMTSAIVTTINSITTNSSYRFNMQTLYNGTSYTVTYPSINLVSGKWIFIVQTRSQVSPYTCTRYIYNNSSTPTINTINGSGTTFTPENSFVFGIGNVNNASSVRMRNFMAFTTILDEGSIHNIYNYTKNI